MQVGDCIWPVSVWVRVFYSAGDHEPLVALFFIDRLSLGDEEDLGGFRMNHNPYLWLAGSDTIAPDVLPDKDDEPVVERSVSHKAGSKVPVPVFPADALTDPPGDVSARRKQRATRAKTDRRICQEQSQSRMCVTWLLREFRSLTESRHQYCTSIDLKPGQYRRWVLSTYRRLSKYII